MNNKAQGTVEYLVIIAVVVVISLVVVGLVINVSSSPTQQIKDSSSKLNTSTSGGISVIESVLDPQGDSLIKLGNNSSDAITLTRISVGGVNNDFSEQLVGRDSKTFSLSNLSSGCTCASGQKSVSCEYVINYTQNGIAKTDRLTKTIECVADSVPVAPSSVVGLGSGTSADPWIINSCIELQDMNKNLDGNYALGADINCLDTRNWNNGAGFNPVGTCGSSNECGNNNYIYSYRGNFDGKNYRILNLFINRPSVDDIGLFGVISSSSTIQNFGLIDGNIIGAYYVGSIVGESYGSINNSYSTGVVQGDSVVGGITGYTEHALVRNVYNTGNVNGSTGYTGGIVGYSYDNSLVINSYNTGAISGYGGVGGIVGFNVNSSYIINSFNSGFISGSSSSFAFGGICGINGNNSVLINTYNLGNVVGKNYVGGLCGWNTNASLISNSYNAGDVNGRNGSYTGGVVGVSNRGMTQYFPSTIKNSFSVGKVYGSSDTKGGVSINSDTFPPVISSILNMYWYDQVGDNATACYPSGDANCTKATNLSDFYPKTFGVYNTTLPYWDDGNWVWQDNNYPKLSWQ